MIDARATFDDFQREVLDALGHVVYVAVGLLTFDVVLEG